MRLIHSAAGLCMMLLACSVHTETMAASQKVEGSAADDQARAGVGQRGGGGGQLTEGGQGDTDGAWLYEEGRGGEEFEVQQSMQSVMGGQEKECEQRDAQAAMTEGGSNRVQQSMQAYLTVSDIPGNCGDVGVYAGSDNGVTGPKKKCET